MRELLTLADFSPFDRRLSLACEAIYLDMLSSGELDDPEKLALAWPSPAMTVALWRGESQGVKRHPLSLLALTQSRERVGYLAVCDPVSGGLAALIKDPSKLFALAENLTESSSLNDAFNHLALLRNDRPAEKNPPEPPLKSA